MGCDISCYCEVRSGGKWRFVEGAYDPENYLHKWWIESDRPLPFWDDRIYAAFAVLADVRNLDDIPPIAPPRGVPGGLSLEVLEEYEEYGDGHSHSWVTLAELETYDWQSGGIKEEVGTLYTSVIPQMRQLGRPEDVRLVFWFDS